MLLLFWLSTLGLLALAFALLLPWFLKIPPSFFIFIAIGSMTYSIYFVLGNSQHLKAYYAINQEQHARMQPLMVQLKKQEYRLRLHLEEYPNDNLAHSQLLEILGIQALQAGDKEFARNCLQEALAQLEGMELRERKQHLHAVLRTLE